MKKTQVIYRLCVCMLTLSLTACSIYKYVPEGEYLLNDIEIQSEGKTPSRHNSYAAYSYQQPNTSWLGINKLPLRIYSLSGKSGEREHKLFRKIGEAPVIYNTLLTEASRADMETALHNSGYLDARVEYKTKTKRKPKTNVIYNLIPGEAYRVTSIEQDIQDPQIESILAGQNHQSKLRPGMPLDIELLDKERGRIVTLLANRGYYAFHKDYITFRADTFAASHTVKLKMTIAPYGTAPGGVTEPHPTYRLAAPDYILTGKTDWGNLSESFDSVEIDEGRLFFEGEPKLSGSVIERHSFLREGSPYSMDTVQQTYSSLSKLSLIKYSNIRFEEKEKGSHTLVPKVYLVTQPKYSFMFEMEGTNTAGDLGAAASLSLTNRNMFKGSEQLTIKLRGAYEAISQLQDYAGESYREYGIETSLDFPSLLAPFVSKEFQRKSQAKSQLSVKFNAQERPEFSRFVFSAAWGYLWNSSVTARHRLDLIDLSYLVVPWISDTFLQEYLVNISNTHSILLHNYEDILISKIGYSYYKTNANTAQHKRMRYSLRTAVETSGNILYGASKLFSAPRGEYGQYEIIDIAFAQYVKHDLSLTLNWSLTEGHNLVFHFEYGVAFPYKNSSSLPFEKRYFSGGANNVRGWSVRELGPGSFQGSGHTTHYIEHSGDIKLGGNIEYRGKLFWKLQGALFVDAGNIWTIKDYPEQPDGVFDFGTFYKQIALSYGAGLRLDLDFLILRIDGGVKALNPAFESGKERYPLLHPNFRRDVTFHFAVGYPF